LFRIGAGGFEQALAIEIDPWDPFGGTLTRGPDGTLYWSTSSSDRQTRLLRIDPSTMTITGWTGIRSGTVVEATDAGVVVEYWTGDNYLVSYDVFDTDPETHPPAVWNEQLLTVAERQLSVGEDGSVAELERVPGESDECDGQSVGLRPLGTDSWVAEIDDFLMPEELHACKAIDIDTRPGGGLVITLIANEGTHLLDVTQDRHRERLVRVADVGANPSTTLDADGRAVISYTLPVSCPGDPPPHGCSVIETVVYHAGNELDRQHIRNPEQTLRPFLGFVGASYLYVADGQIAQFVLTSPDNVCQRVSNCTPSGSILSVGTIVTQVSRPDRVWGFW
jgi:hypothetical protein